MSREIQSATVTCQGGAYHCGAQAIVTPTESPYEFDVYCSTCQQRSVTSWSHQHPAPKFVPLPGTKKTTAEGAGPRANNVKGKAAMKKTREEILENAVPMAELTNRVLFCDLSLDEQRERGAELADVMAEHNTLLEEKKEIVNSYKAKEQQILIKLGQLQQTVQTRREFREVDCVEWHDYRAGKVYVVRDDLGTIVETRLMTHTERQAQLPHAIAERAMDHTAEQLGLEKVGEKETDAKRSSRKKEREAGKAATASA